jgi:hypothetical protein
MNPATLIKVTKLALTTASGMGIAHIVGCTAKTFAPTPTLFHKTIVMAGSFGMATAITEKCDPAIERKVDEVGANLVIIKDRIDENNRNQDGP